MGIEGRFSAPGCLSHDQMIRFWNVKTSHSADSGLQTAEAEPRAVLRMAGPSFQADFWKNVTGNATATADVTTVSHWMSSGDSNWLTPSCLRKMIIFLDVLVHEIENIMSAMPALLQVNTLALWGFQMKTSHLVGADKSAVKGFVIFLGLFSVWIGNFKTEVD